MSRGSARGSPFRVGLTGGIASGKSTVSRRFAACGVPVIDTDQLAREVVAPGSEGLTAVAETFGEGVLCADGTLDRAALGERVFADAAARKTLEGLLHPRIRAAMEARCRAMAAPWVLVVVPLLFETEMDREMDRTLVVDMPEMLQKTRLQQRDGLSSSSARQRIAAQMDRATRCAHADDRLENRGDIRSLTPGILQLHRTYLHLARTRPSAVRGAS